MAKHFNSGKIIWGKVDGYPWWPGIVKSIQGKSYEVQFFGDFSRAFLRQNKIRDFHDKQMEELKRKEKFKTSL